MADEVTIQYEDVYKRFDTPVLSGVSLSVMRGETISILGTSGTGKSVLLKTTIGLITPDQGDVKIDGQSVYHSSRIALRDLRKTVRYVFQYAALFDSLNIYDNVAMGLDPETIQRLDRKSMLDRIAASLENVNLDPGKVLSGFDDVNRTHEFLPILRQIIRVAFLSQAKKSRVIVEKGGLRFRWTRCRQATLPAEKRTEPFVVSQGIRLLIRA